MKTTDNGRALARSRANQRLRNLTIGTAVFGVAATGGLGWLAAMTYDGSSAAATTVTAVATTGTTTTGTTAGTSTSTGVAATAAPVVTAVGGTAHATTGGS
jgi:hypothetical protein